MSPLDQKELKRLLLDRGFEIYRTLQDRFELAERVRENLIMDSGVAVTLAGEVFMTLRAHRRDFPLASEADLFQEARALGSLPVNRGYTEHASRVHSVFDPGDPKKLLDIWYEVTLVRSCDPEEELFTELRFALGLKKNTSTDED